MKVPLKLVEGKIELNASQKLKVSPRYTIEFEISDSIGIGSGPIKHTFDVVNGTFEKGVTSQIQAFCNTIESDANSVFNGLFPPFLPDFPAIIFDGQAIGSSLSFGLGTSLENAALFIKNGNLTLSVDPFKLAFGTLEISTVFDIELNDNELDIFRDFSVGVTFTFENIKISPPKLPQGFTSNEIVMLTLGGLAVVTAVGAVAASPAVATAIASAVGTFANYLEGFFQRALA